MTKTMRKENVIMQIEDNKTAEFKSRGYEEVTEAKLREDAKKALKNKVVHKKAASNEKSGEKTEE